MDASQSAGILPFELDTLGAAFIAMPGHKGLYGPQGTGLLLCGDGEAAPLLEGGTGSLSIQQEMPDFLPDRLEAGTHNMPGIAGLLEGLRFVEQQGVGRIAGHERHLTRHMAALLRDIPGAEVFYTPEDGAQTGVLSFRLDGWDCEALGADAVLIGRPFVNMVYGGGAEGVQVYVDKLKAELADTMAMCGAHCLADIKRSMIFGY